MDLREKLEQLKTEKNTVSFIRPGGWVVTGTIQEIGGDFVTIRGKVHTAKDFRDYIIPFQNLCLSIAEAKEKSE